MVPEDPALWLLLALYTASETLGVGVLLFAGSIPLQVLVFGKMKREDPDAYPLTAVGIGIGISVSAGVWAGDWDWRLFALMVPAAFFFGNVVEPDRIAPLGRGWDHCLKRVGIAGDEPAFFLFDAVIQIS